MKISAIMPSFLGDYPGAAGDRDIKFKRAVDSFINQIYENKELIIISDGCRKTNKLYRLNYAKYDNIHLVKMKKQPTLSGDLRQAGIDKSSGMIITYLDSDDFYCSVTHLSTIAHGIIEQNVDFVYCDEQLGDGKILKAIKDVSLVHGSAGASSISHRKSVDATWTGLSGRSHDWKFIERLMMATNNYKKIMGGGYAICHLMGQFDV